MRNYDRIEKIPGMAHYTGYGANGELYVIVKHSREFYASCRNANVPIMQYNRYRKTLREINEWLGGLA